MKVNIGAVELTPAGTSKAGRPVYKGHVDLPVGRVYVSLYGDAPAAEPAAPRARRKSLDTPHGHTGKGSALTPDMVAALRAALGL